jgi:hypothetical protein
MNGSRGWVFMFLGHMRIKKFIAVGVITIGFLFLCAQDSIADSPSIKSVMKIHRMGGYVILINYETNDKWTDNLLFKVYCKFNEGEFEFVSSSLNNIERGWHKTEISISDVIKKRYGSLQEYRVDLYKSGILVDSKKSY